MVVFGDDEGGGRHACATELYLVRPIYLHAEYCSYKRQGVAGPHVRTTAYSVVVHPAGRCTHMWRAYGGGMNLAVSVGGMGTRPYP